MTQSSRKDIEEVTITQEAMQRDTETMPRVRMRRRSRWLLYLGILGPGLVAASAGNDAGGIFTYSTMGARYGYSMIWIMVVLTAGMAVVQEMCTRMGTVTGKGLSDLIRENFPIRLTAFVMLSLLLANSGVIITEFIGIATALSLFNVPAYISSPVAGILLWLLVVRGSYSRVEKVFLALTLVFIAYFIAAFMAHPNWGQVAYGTFVPTLQLNNGFLFTIIAAVGTTISPYMQIYVQSAVVERGANMRDYNNERIDVYSAAIFSDIVAAFIIIATAATLFVHSGGKGVMLASAGDAALALAPFLGKFATYVFAIGLLGASFLAAGVLPLSTCYSITEALGLENGVNKRLKEAPVFWGLFTGLIVIGVVISILPNLPVVQVLLNLYLLNGILLPIILFSILALVNNKRLMGVYTNGPIFNAVAYGLTIVVSLLAIAYLVLTVLGIFNIHILP